MHDKFKSTARCLIQDVISTGGTGLVLRAWDQYLQRPIAIKRPRTDADMDANTRRAAGILAALHHANKVTIYNFVSDELGQFAVMDYVEGRTLGAAFSREPFLLPTFAELASQVWRSLPTAHSRGLVHLDSKSGNLMLQFHEDRSFTCGSGCVPPDKFRLPLTGPV